MFVPSFQRFQVTLGSSSRFLQFRPNPTLDVVRGRSQLLLDVRMKEYRRQGTLQFAPLAGIFPFVDRPAGFRIEFGSDLGPPADRPRTEFLSTH